MRQQQQFLNVIDRDEAERRFHAALTLAPLPAEQVPLEEALGRVLAEEVVAGANVPAFDRSNYDGFAVRAADTYGAGEETPRRLRLLEGEIPAGASPSAEVAAGTAMAIATGGMLPRGADAVVMIEHADGQDDELLVRKAVAAGFGIAAAGSDIALGETVLRQGELLTSRETGVLAAIGVARVAVVGAPHVAIISTGDELIPPGAPLKPAQVYDSNAQILADAVRELGGRPVRFGIVGDRLEALRDVVHTAREQCDLVLLSGGTSKGAGDLCYRVVEELSDPGIVAHGVALKPGKPICLAASGGKGVVILPGFPTSAVFTFHEFVAPVVRRLAGRRDEARGMLTARMAVKAPSEIGRQEYLLVNLLPSAADGDAAGEPAYAAYPLGKGSGSVTAFSRADGFVTIDRATELVPAGTPVGVTLLGREVRPADLVVIGSHDLGLDYLLGLLREQGYQAKLLAVGSSAGLEAARRGECDVAGVHLYDRVSDSYNTPFLTDELRLIRGYRRWQGVVYRPGDMRFEGQPAQQAIDAVKHDPQCRMINRNAGSGTRMLIDRCLAGVEPPGYSQQPRSHHAVTAAIAQARADWGVAIRPAAERAALGFLPLAEEQYDFLTPRSRCDRPAVRALAELLASDSVREELRRRGVAE